MTLFIAIAGPKIMFC